MAVLNTLAYYVTTTITTVKSFVVMAPRRMGKKMVKKG
jgi:hypothetical protein